MNGVENDILGSKCIKLEARLAGVPWHGGKTDGLDRSFK
jgi:hypothetical protein